MSWNQASIVETFGFECYANQKGDDNPKGQPPGTVSTRHLPALILGMGLAYQVRFGMGIDALRSYLWVLDEPDGFMLLSTVEMPNGESIFDLSCDVDDSTEEFKGHTVRVKEANGVGLEVMDPIDSIDPSRERPWNSFETLRVYVTAAWDKPKNAWPDKQIAKA